MEPRGRKRRKEGEKEDMKSDNSERWGEMAQAGKEVAVKMPKASLSRE